MKKLHRIFTLLAVLFVATTGQVCAEWVHCGLYFTYIYCFTNIPDGAGGTSLFTGSDGYGVYLSTNNGEDWTAVNTGLTNKHIFALAVNGTNLFAGTYGGGVF
ncbi:MAG TPA: hypothetical protein VGD14_00730, partial [bacterium]